MQNGSAATDRPSVAIETHGCKLNTADSQQLARELVAAGYALASNGTQPDVYVLNSCTVTHVADRKARQAITAARRRHPEALVVAAGCYAQRDPETLAALAGVDLVVTNRQRPRFVEILTGRLGASLTPCADGAVRPGGPLLLGRTRASVKIQEGCNQVCAYCIVPTVRGRERSVPVEALVQRVNELVDGGCREVVLTGTQLGSYGFDLESTSLAGMIQNVLDETGIERLRVSSLQPQELTRELLEVWGRGGMRRLCPHFHIPLQAGSNRILKQMRRRYTAVEFLQAVDAVRAAVPGASVTIDVIAGFPGETESDFKQTLEFVEKAAPASAHVFPYSVRPGTSAAHFDGHLPPEVRAARAARLREVAGQSAERFKKTLVGAVRPVLWERDDPPAGLTDNYVTVLLDTDADDGRDRFNSIEDIELTGVSGDGMLGRPATSHAA